MKITPIGIIPPKGTEQNYALPPELLASVLARYSRSNEGIDAILKKVDLQNPEASIERILKFTDYGHASIGGLTGGLVLTIDNISMWLAYRLFNLAQQADGQESSTRYIEMNAGSLPNPLDLGFSSEIANRVTEFWERSLKLYQQEYARLDKLAQEHPELIRFPANANAKIKERIRKNYALDRTRYFIPLALQTNVALIMTARAWAEVASALLSSPQKEAVTCGEGIKSALMAYAPKLLKHARAKRGFQYDIQQETQKAITRSKSSHAGLENLPNKESVQTTISDWGRAKECTPEQLRELLAMRENRYDRCPELFRDITVKIIWPNMAIAEIRDLNRHRTGHRYTPLSHEGFYLPPEVEDSPHGKEIRAHLKVHTQLVHRVMDTEPLGLHVYALALGSQTQFSHTLQLDKFIYEAELRTGPGSHYLYAEHLRNSVASLDRQMPGLQEAITLGEAEPE